MKWLKIAGGCIGIFLLIFLIHRYHFQTILHSLALVNFWIIPLFLVSATWLCSYTKAWSLFFKGDPATFSFWRWLRLRISAEAVNTSTPLNFLVGDPVRYYMIHEVFGERRTITSLVVDRFNHLLATVTATYAGLWITLFVYSSISLTIKMILLGCYSVLFFSLLLFFISVLRGNGVKIMEKIALFVRLDKLFPSLKRHMDPLIEELHSFSKNSHKKSLQIFILHLFGRSLTYVEIAILLRAITGSFNTELAIALGSTTVVINMLFAFIPGAMGIMEGLYAHLATTHSFSPEVGISIQIMRRIRALFWLSVGWIIFSGKRKRTATNNISSN